MKTLILALALIQGANAGIVRFTTYPLRHPVKMAKKTGHVIKVVLW